MPAADGSLAESPPPVLLNTFKHHADTLRQRICSAIAKGQPGLDELARNLVVIGTKLMDLYTGPLTPRQIGEEVIRQLGPERLEQAAFRAWIEEGGGYRVIPFPDGSQWVLRLADERDRYVHAHPGRWVPNTCRVRANVLKTALLVLAHAGIHGGDPMDVALVNAVRQRYLGLAPLGRGLADDEGLGSVLALLRTDAT